MMTSQIKLTPIYHSMPLSYGYFESKLYMKFKQKQKYAVFLERLSLQGENR